MNHNWPGNIRELENVIERAINVARSDRIELEDLPQNMQSEKLLEKQQTGDADGTVLNKLQKVEKKAIIEALKKNKGNISKASESVGLGRRSMYRRLEIYDIDPSDYK